MIMAAWDAYVCYFSTRHAFVVLLIDTFLAVCVMCACLQVAQIFTMTSVSFAM
jgi:hypothetical protein